MGLFGIHEVLSSKLVTTTIVVESIDTIIMAVTAALGVAIGAKQFEHSHPRLSMIQGTEWISRSRGEYVAVVG
jgi:hypothetical protein